MRLTLFVATLGLTSFGPFMHVLLMGVSCRSARRLAMLAYVAVCVTGSGCGRGHVVVLSSPHAQLDGLTFCSPTVPSSPLDVFLDFRSTREGMHLVRLTVSGGAAGPTIDSLTEQVRARMMRESEDILGDGRMEAEQPSRRCSLRRAARRAAGRPG